MRIALLGPESSGKTTLAMQLAAHFKTQWVPEFAREFVEKNSLKYSLEDIIAISEKQLALEKKAEKLSNKYIFCDTDMIYLKVWCELSFQKIPESILQKCNHHKYDLYLLTKPDIPWKYDPVRELPNDREKLFLRYQKEIENSKTPYYIITGLNEKRFECAVKAVERFKV